MEFVYYFFVLLQLQFVLLCNGSTADSGSVCMGSSPIGATKTKDLHSQVFCFLGVRNPNSLRCFPLLSSCRLGRRW